MISRFVTGAMSLTLAALCFSIPTPGAVAQQMPAAVMDRAKKAVAVYYECIFERFKERGSVIASGARDAKIVDATLSACENKIGAVKVAFQSMPGATAKRVDEQLQNVRTVAMKNMLAVLTAVVVHTSTPTSAKPN